MKPTVLCRIPDRAKAIITANTPGTTTEDFSLFPYQKLRRPIYPLDPGMEFEA